MKAEDLEKIPDRIARIFIDLETRTMEDVIRRIKINEFSTASADWQITRLQQLGASEKSYKEAVRNALKATDEELDKIFSDELYKEYTGFDRAYKINGVKRIPFEENRELQSLVDATKKQITKGFDNLANSSGFAISKGGTTTFESIRHFYRRTLDAAVIDIESGSFDYQRVLERTVRDLSRSGLRMVEYSGGYSERVEVAARRAVLTGFRQLQAQINEQVATDLHTDTYEVSWHAGARPDHAVWQGRVYTMDELRSVCGLGDITGLCGANCYHDYTPFVQGVSTRTYTDQWLDEKNQEEATPRDYLGKEYTVYEATQRQRELERRMRANRRTIQLLKEGDSSEEAIKLVKAKYHGTKQEYKAFSTFMKMPDQMERVYIDGLGRY